LRVAIAGAGNVGQFIAADLLPSGHEVVMLERDPAVVEYARKTLDKAEWFIVDACEVLSLEFAGLRHADVVVAATGDDEDNLVISLLAKQEFAVPRVVARVNNPKNHTLFTDAWGVDVAVSTPHILRSLVEEAVTVGTMVRLMNFEQGHVSLHEVTLAEGSPSIGRTLRELGLPMDAAVVAVVREQHVVLPREDTVLAVGDEVLAIASDESEEALRRALVAEQPSGEEGSREATPSREDGVRRNPPSEQPTDRAALDRD
jgi:trk system potassium uptake protein TrkA